MEILIDQMELFVLASHELLAQWTRAAFHDAGTFDQNDNVGGANGCLMNHAPMRSQPENNFFDAPINTLQVFFDQSAFIYVIEPFPQRLPNHVFHLHFL